MKIFKPYLSLTKTIDNYVLDVVLAVSKDYSLEKISQQEFDVDGTMYWGVIITTSMKTQLMNGPEMPIFSTSVDIDLNKPDTYQTIKCIVQQILPDGNIGPAQDQESDIDFNDG